MFGKLISSLKANLTQALGIPTALSGITFVSNVVQSLSDGHLSHSELQTLISSTSGIETILLGALMFIVRR